MDKEINNNKIGGRNENKDTIYQLPQRHNKGEKMKRTWVRVIVVGGKEYQEEFGTDGKRYIFSSTDKKSRFSHSITYSGITRRLKENLIPYSVYKKEIFIDGIAE